MKQYLVSIHHPDDYDPLLQEDEAMHRDIDVLNEEMIAAGIRVFVGGLKPAGEARSLRSQPGGKVIVTDGPYLETKEHVGGFWVAGSRQLGRSAGVGSQGRHRLPRSGRGAPVP